MIETPEGPGLYLVSYSLRVRERLLELADMARIRGDGDAFLAALRDFDRQLHVYPQFGDPLMDLQAEFGQIRLGIVAPLAMRFGVIEDRRQVFVAALPVLMPARLNDDHDSLD